MSGGWIRAHLLAVGACCCMAAGASADVVMLRNGGRVRGELRTAEDAPVLVVTTLLGGTVAIEQSAVDNVERRTPLVEEYETRARDAAHDVESHWALADWCKANSLMEQRAEQLLLLLDIEPDHAEARKILGHVRHNGRWMTRDEWMTARGYVRHHGKYVTRQERDLLLKSETERTAEQAWYPKVRQWFNWLTGGNAQRAAEGRKQFSALKDPDAVPALVNFLGGHQDSSVRMMCVQLLTQMPGMKPVEPLVRQSLYDDDHDIRIAARNALKPEQQALALEFYVPELRNESNKVVQRAAVAIRDMGDITVVPYLIAALVTNHTWRFEVPAGINVTVTSSSYVPSEVEMLARTGQLPYGAVVTPSPGQTQATRAVTIKGDVRNAEVLEALKKITGQDFGYNKRAWEVWWQTQAHS